MRILILFLLVFISACDGSDYNTNYDQEFKELENDMGFVRFDRHVVDSDTGATIPSASVTVYINEGPEATIYSDEGVTPLANPFNADSDGRAVFYVEPGVYDIVAVGPAGSITYPSIVVNEFLGDEADFTKDEERLYEASTIIAQPYTLPFSTRYEHRAVAASTEITLSDPASPIQYPPQRVYAQSFDVDVILSGSASLSDLNGDPIATPFTITKGQLWHFYGTTGGNWTGYRLADSFPVISGMVRSGNRYVKDGSASISAITISAPSISFTETVGKSGSTLPDTTWSAIAPYYPDGAKTIILGVQYQGSVEPSPTSNVVRTGISAKARGATTLTQYDRSYSNAISGQDYYVGNNSLTVVEIPVDENGDFVIYMEYFFAPSGITGAGIRLDFIGFTI